LKNNSLIFQSTKVSSSRKKTSSNKYSSGLKTLGGQKIMMNLVVDAYYGE